MKKVAVIGSAGSGKSTFARKLAKRLNADVIHLDTLFWKPGWVESSMEELQVKQEPYLQRERWVIEGNYSRTWHRRFEEADTIIFLDMPRYLCMYRVIKRYVTYKNKTRPDMSEGCPEKLDFEFLKFVWHYPKERRKKALDVIALYSSSKQTMVFRKRKEIDQFLSN
ncbi:DNA topology modulation protein [Alkalihalobacillus sp. LMS39]|uniref:DNA topology modulation protein n=1 Tax=Alkalihalobacillus sp. LMS39 TaxID=2924032 RepID=UPI001FB34986|nr:DNA topology modulation protein [Alkalihalobacillus sp. LMS39]UOE93245.1 DNA topology modulation protein [Alkalihalobacillus sp. LMS39]